MTEATTEAATLDLEGLNGKTVLFTIKAVDGSTSQVEGFVEAASAIGVAFKQKGKSTLAMYEPKDIVAAEVLPDKPKVLKQKVLQPIPLDQVRAHLADRHGINLTWLNASTNEEAAAFHDSLDHVGGEAGPLGHRHEVKSEKKDEAAELEQALADN